MTPIKTRDIRIITEPTIFAMAQMSLMEDAYEDLVKWLEENNPECLDKELLEECKNASAGAGFFDELLFPHDGFEGDDQRCLSDNELLVELAGRKCYNSFGKKAGQRTNAAYIANLFGAPGKVPHLSVLYHAKMTFFFGGLSRRVSHELIRNYVGSDRSEEGSPSQESTRFTHHPGAFIIHPRDMGDPAEIGQFTRDMQSAYDRYQAYLTRQLEGHKEAHGVEPTGMDRKRIYEAAAGRLTGAACTSFIWTTNPAAVAKLIWERSDDASDLEIQRFARKLKSICHEKWPNLFRESNPAYEVANPRSSDQHDPMVR